MVNSYQSKMTFQPLAEKQGEILLSEQDEIIQCALKCLENRIKYHSDQLTSSRDTRDYVRLQLGQELNEIFGVLFLDSKHRVLAFEKLFQGTIDSAAVHPRVVVQRALAHNAAAVILTHNHSSGSLLPSTADEELTRRLKDILKNIDVNVLDHIIVTAEDTLSFAEHGLL